MKPIIRFAIFFLILCNLPGYLLAYISPALGSITSYSTSLLILLYFILAKDFKSPLWPFITLGFTYYVISGFNVLLVPEMVYIKEFIRFMILVVCAAELLHDAKKYELYLPLLVGAISIIVNAILFPRANVNFTPDYGRFSGFYLNPNFAGAICLVGYALTYTVKPIWFRLIGQLIFTLGGLFTFSRTFIVVWLFINLLAALHKRTNLLAPISGAMVLLIFLSISTGLTVNKQRFKALEGLLSGKQTTSQTRTIKENSRSQTWANYYDYILDKPLVGNGYSSFQGNIQGLNGVHNSYLLVIGEAGIIPFIIMVSLYLYIIRESFRLVKSNPEYFYISIVLSLTLLASHMYFTTYYNVLVSMYLFVQIRLNKYSKTAKVTEDGSETRNQEHLVL